MYFNLSYICTDTFVLLPWHSVLFLLQVAGDILHTLLQTWQHMTRPLLHYLTVLTGQERKQSGTYVNLWWNNCQHINTHWPLHYLPVFSEEPWVILGTWSLPLWLFFKTQLSEAIFAGRLGKPQSACNWVKIPKYWYSIQCCLYYLISENNCYTC